jgi:hypothetical protein
MLELVFMFEDLICKMTETLHPKHGKIIKL